MAGLGEAASIAGLISLAGQTIQATSKLYTFFQTYKTIHTQFERTGQELESLEDVLRQIERVITNATVKGSTPIDVIVTLEARVKECRDDIEKWTKKVELLGLDGAKSTKRVITKLKVTADKAYFTRVREQLCFHRSQINLSLGVLGLDVSLSIAHHSRAADDGIDALWTYQNLFQGGTYHRLDVVGADIRNVQSEQTASLATARNMVDIIHQSYVDNMGATRLSLNAMDARLSEIQEQLRYSIQDRLLNSTARQATSRKAVKRKVPHTARKLELVGCNPDSSLRVLQSPISIPLRLVKPGLLIRDLNGRLTFELVALEDVEYTAADVELKGTLIERARNLRLMIWLLQRQQHLSCAEFCKLSRSTHYNFVSQAHLSSRWQFFSSFSTLRDVLESHHASLLEGLPWIFRKPWLQYIGARIIARKLVNNSTAMELIFIAPSASWIQEESQATSYDFELPQTLVKLLSKLMLIQKSLWDSIRIAYKKDTWEIEYSYPLQLPTPRKRRAWGSKGGGGRFSDLQAWHGFRKPRFGTEDTIQGAVRIAYAMSNALERSATQRNPPLGRTRSKIVKIFGPRSANCVEI